MSSTQKIEPEEPKKKARRSATEAVGDAVAEKVKKSSSRTKDGEKKKSSSSKKEPVVEEEKIDANQPVAFAGTDGQLPDPVGNTANADDDDESNSEDERDKLHGNDAHNKILSYTKMLKYKDMMHPRIKTRCGETGDITYTKHSVWKTKTGFHHPCRSKHRKSDFAPYGVGSVLYFQFLKYLGCLFTMSFILAIPSMLFFYYGTSLPDSSLASVVAGTSLGNLGGALHICNSGRFDLLTEGASRENPSLSIQLSCPYGHIDHITQLGQISIGDKIDCAEALKEDVRDIGHPDFSFYPTECEYHQFAEDDRYNFEEKFRAQCYYKEECTFTFELNDLPVSSCTLPQAKVSSWQYAVMADCESTSIKFGGNEVKVTKSLVGIVVVFFDLAITFFFWCSMIALNQLQDATENEVNQGVVQSQDYTVMITQRSHLEKTEDLPGIYYAWCENINAHEAEQYQCPNYEEVDENQNNVWNVSLGLTNLGYFTYMKKMGKLLIRKKKLDKNLRKLNQNNGTEKAKAKIQTQTKKLQHTAYKILKKGNDYKENNPAKAGYAFVQFQSMNGKRKFLKAMNIGACKRWCLRMKKKQDTIEHKYMAGSWPEVVSAPDPSLIVWENLGKGKIERCGRSTVTNIFAFGLLLVGLGALVFLLNLQEQYKQDLSMCGALEITEDDAFLDWHRHENPESDINTCFCSQILTETGSAVKDFTFPDGSLPCKIWMEHHELAGQLAILVSASMASINGILRFVLRYSSFMEGHHSATTRIRSSFSKMWVLQFVNTAIILLIINNRLADHGIIRRALIATGAHGFAFNGEFHDFDPKWYSVVGVTIFTTCLINGLTPIAVVNEWAVGYAKGCVLDRGCSRDEKKTKKVIQSEYEKVYLGREVQYDNRLSQNIAMIWAIMMFSAVMPMLYLAGALLCLTTYWSDKLLFIKYYCLPPRHGSDLAHKARSIIEWSLVAHLLMGLYMLSNPAIFGHEDEEEGGVVQFFSLYAKAVGSGIAAATGADPHRFGQVHAVLYSAGIGVFGVMFVFEKVSGTFSRLMGRLCCRRCLYKDADPEIFSSDLFLELPAEAQRKEYDDAKRRLKMLKGVIEKDSHNEFVALRCYYKERINLKLKSIRYHMACGLSLTEVAKGSLKKTQDAWVQLEKNVTATHDLFSERLKGLYSYDVLDSPAFAEAKKIEQRIAEFDKKNRTRQENEKQKYIDAARESIKLAKSQKSEADLTANGDDTTINLARAIKVMEDSDKKII